MEELRMILDTLSALGGASKDVAMWWLIAHYGTKLTVILGLTVFGICAVWFIGRAITFNSTSERLCRDMAAILNVRDFDTWYGPDRRRFIDALNTAIQTAKGK